MGMFDGLIAQALGGAQAGGQAANPLGSILGSVASSLGTGSSGGSLGGMLGGMLGGSGNRPAAGGIAGGSILAAVMLLLQQQGGIGAVLSKLQSSGLGAHAESWVGSGPNMPVTGDQLHQALGADALSGLASKLGVDTQQAGSVLSQVLPALVNHMTPSGQVPENHGDLLSQGLEALRGLGHH